MTSAPAEPQAGADLEKLLRRGADADLLRFTTAGSVDSGKSTLMGRLLYDSQAVYDDQVAAVRNSRINRSGGPMDFALLLDGLRAEREQGITIDVAYRYFNGKRRRFIVADTPGHEQYTRNMATGASHADAAVVVIDATEGLRVQSRRHFLIAHLFGIRQLIAVINKMDRRDFSQAAYQELRDETAEFLSRLGVAEMHAIPVCAVDGDNIVHRGERMGWYEGPTLLELLETLPTPETAAGRPLRLPVQYVIRPNADFRGFAGQIASGSLRPGQTVRVLPSGLSARVERIVAYEGDLEAAAAPASVTVTLDRQLDVGRGEMLADAEAPPLVGARLAATVVWMHADPLETGRWYLLKQTSRIARARARRIRHRLDLMTLAPAAAETLELNEIGEVEWELSQPLAFDLYTEERATGSFLLIDPATNATLGAGLILAALEGEAGGAAEPGRGGAGGAVSGEVGNEERWARLGQRPALLWARGTGAAAGRTGAGANAASLERELFSAGLVTARLERGPGDGGALAALAAIGAVVVYWDPEGGADRLDLERQFPAAVVELETAGAAAAVAAVIAAARRKPASEEEASPT